MFPFLLVHYFPLPGGTWLLSKNMSEGFLTNWLLEKVHFPGDYSAASKDHRALVGHLVSRSNSKVSHMTSNTTDGLRGMAAASGGWKTRMGKRRGQAKCGSKGVFSGTWERAMTFQENFSSTIGLFLRKPTLPDLWIDKTHRIFFLLLQGLLFCNWGSKAECSSGHRDGTSGWLLSSQSQIYTAGNTRLTSKIEIVLKVVITKQKF